MTLPRQATCTFCGTTFFPTATTDDASGGEARPARARLATPFCSERCRLDDLGRWLDGGYVIAGPPVTVDDDGDDRRGGAPS